MPAGRPTKYNKKIATAICEAIIAGSSVRRLCESNRFPSQPTVYAWLLKYPEFLKMYSLACEMREDNYADETVAIADDESRDMYESEKGFVPNTAKVRRDDLRVKARMWHVSKLHPKKYGDRQTVENINPPANPVTIYIPDNGRDNGTKKDNQN